MHAGKVRATHGIAPTHIDERLLDPDAFMLIARKHSLEVPQPKPISEDDHARIRLQSRN